MFISYIYLILSTAALSLTVWGVLLALKYFFINTKHSLNHYPPVTILKPLKGIDSDLRENLLSFFDLDYAEYEIIFSVDDESDPAKPIAEDLIKTHSQINAKLIVGDDKIGLNPKINNIIRGYDQAKYDHILISDSNVRVKPDYLKTMVSSLKGKVGVVTSVILGKHDRGIGGHLEAAYLNTFYAKSMFLTKRFGHPCVIGKSMLFLKSTAERFGGLRSLKNYLAEDYMFGLAVQRLDYTVAYSQRPVTQHIGRYSFKKFWNRHVRWGRIRKSHAPAAFIIEPFIASAFFACILFGSAIENLTTYSAFKASAWYFLVWGILDHIIHFALRRKIKPFYPLIWMLREVLFLPLWIHITLGQTVDWRGTIYKLKRGGSLEKPNEHKRTSLWHKAKQKIFYGELQQAAIKSKDKTSTTTGGTGNTKATSKEEQPPETPVTTGTDSKKT